MNPTSPAPQRFRLTASNISAYFKNHCDRNFRYETTTSQYRGKPGIGWNVPVKVRKHSRPGIALLMQAGGNFEADRVQSYIDEHGAAAVLTEGIEATETRRQVRDLPFVRFAKAFARPPFPQFVAQLEVLLAPDQEARLLEQFGLDPGEVTLGRARPDLLEVLPPAIVGGRHKLRIWDFKASQAARHDHFIQVAYYSYVLDHAVREADLPVEVDLEEAAIYSRQGAEEFELRPYRLAVGDFLRNRTRALFAARAADAHFHVADHCAMCEYMDHCRAEADAHFDLSRVAYMSSESKRRLRGAGVRNHRELAALDDSHLTEKLRASSHDLSINLDRYVATARALEDGLPRPLGATTLLMPRYEDVRVVMCAEQDAVTQTCFALGLKIYEGWDAEDNRVLGAEHAFVAAERDGEAQLLLEFLRHLNELLLRTDAANREVESRSVDDEPAVAAARRDVEAAEESLGEFKVRCPQLRKTDPRHDELSAARDELKGRLKTAQAAHKQSVKDARREVRRRMRKLHFYVYDSFDLHILRGLIERHLFDETTPELLEQMASLVRLFPPASVLPDADTFRTVPGTVVTQVLKKLVALPTPYLYDLSSVSRAYQLTNEQGEEKGWEFKPRYGFGWEFSNQVAYERIHDVWDGEAFHPSAKDRDRAYQPEQILELIRDTVKSKLRATDSVIRRVKREFKEQLLLRKEPFRLHQSFDPLDFKTLEALRTFSLLESSLAELDVKHKHTLPVADRVAKFVCVNNLRYVPGADEEDGSLWFTFDPAAKDAKFDANDFNLVVTPEDQPQVLCGDVDGTLFERNFRSAHLRVTLVEYDLRADPPRVKLRPDDPAKFREKLDLLAGPLALDQLYVDYNSTRVLEVLRQLQENPQNARHVHEMLSGTCAADWSPVVTKIDGAESELRERIAATNRNADLVLNHGQWAAWRGVFIEPLTLIWGPPGTGKTHTVAHILLGYAAAARAANQPLRILVTAFTHHAIANVLKKTFELAAQYGIEADALAVAKLIGGGSAADDELPFGVARIADTDLPALLGREVPCLIVGATVWSTYKGMKETGGVPRAWFDVVLVDEASQMKLPDALIALSAAKHQSNVILAGDDQQLPPIIHGVYPEEHKPLLTSVFAFVRDRMEKSEDRGAEDRVLFQLEDNFRMNEPLTAYPRNVLYRGRFRSTRPDIRIRMSPAIDADSEDLLDLLLHPERPVVLCSYEAPRSFTARNPLEAELIAALVERLSRTLVDERTGRVYTPTDFAETGVAILSPHRAQNSAIRHALRARGFDRADKPLPLVDTVDKLQGKERSTVLVSYGVADEEYAAAEAEFLLSRSRFNVAATRAERKLIVLCSDAVLGVVPADKKVLLESMMLKEFRSYCADGRRGVPHSFAEHGRLTLNVRWKEF